MMFLIIFIIVLVIIIGVFTNKASKVPDKALDKVPGNVPDKVPDKALDKGPSNVPSKVPDNALNPIPLLEYPLMPSYKNQSLMDSFNAINKTYNTFRQEPIQEQKYVPIEDASYISDNGLFDYAVKMYHEEQLSMKKPDLDKVASSRSIPVIPMNY
jgi:hypothetical protein